MTGRPESRWDEELREFIQRREGLVRAKLAPFAEGTDHLDDLVQQTWTRCLHRWSQFRGEGRTAWVLAVARSVAVDDYRARRRREKARRLQPAKPAVSEGGTEHEIEGIRQELGRAFHALTKREEEVVRMRFLNDQPTRSVASALGISESTVRVHLANALRKLRAVLAEGER